MSKNEPSFSRPPNSVKLDDHARDNLRFIRETMERAGSFTAVPGWGGVAIGVTALGAAAIAAQADLVGWVARYVDRRSNPGDGHRGLDNISKARGAGTPLLSGPGRRFVYSFAPSIFVGALLTMYLARTGVMDAVPGTWLLLYGTGMVAAGAFSIRVVPLMGLCFMVLGAVALFNPWNWDNAILAVGFGGLHIIFGAVIARNYGG